MAVVSTNAAATSTASGRCPESPAIATGTSTSGANEIGADHHAPPVPAVGDDAAVEPEDECRHAVGEADGDHAERPAGDEREPHEGDVLERVAELADRDGGVGAPEVPPPQERGGGLRSGRLIWKRSRRLGADRVCHLGSGG